MGDLHLRLTKPGIRGKKKIVAIDTEWAKNWKAAEKFVPFCATVHVLYPPDAPEILDPDRWAMDAELYFRSVDESVQDYAEAVDRILARQLSGPTVVVGHQITSDLHVLRQLAGIRLPAVESVLAGFAARRTLLDGCKDVIVRDTRYDIASRQTGNGAEKLRNVSLRLRVFAVQNELRVGSLTKIFNQFRIDGDRGKMERLIVLNWRHALQTALVWLVDSNPHCLLRNGDLGGEFLLTNRAQYEMGHRHIEYLRSPEFLETLQRRGVAEYVREYAPGLAGEVGL